MIWYHPHKDNVKDVLEQKFFTFLLFFFSLLRRKFAERREQGSPMQTPQFEGGNMNLVLFGFDTGDYNHAKLP